MGNRYTKNLKKTIYKFEVYNNKSILGLFDIKVDRHVFELYYRIDEDRYWFKSDDKEHMTKNGKENSIKILRGIKKRCEHHGYKVNILVKNIKDKKKKKGIFL
jgi:hypothetical protein